MDTIKTDTYRDGGTTTFIIDGQEYCIDNRIGSQTKGKLYRGYPTRGELVETNDPIIKTIRDLYVNECFETRCVAESLKISDMIRSYE